MSLTAFIRCLSGGMAGLRVLHGRSVRTPLTLTSGSTSVRRWQKSTQVPTSKVALQILKYSYFGYRSFPKTHFLFPLLAILPSNTEHVFIWKILPKNLWHNSCTCIRFLFLFIILQLSGNTTYLQDSMNTFKGACFQEVTHDEVYYVNRTTDGRFLADIIFSVLCPRDCSGNGNCTNGNFMERKERG